jgi:hypothetical protein
MVGQIGLAVKSRISALNLHYAAFKPLRELLNIDGQYSDIDESADSSSTGAGVLSNILVPSAA